MFEEIGQIFKDSFYRNWPSLAAVALLGMIVGACNGPADTAREDKQANEDKAMDADLDTKGFTQVGTTPDGKPLYMKQIRKGYLRDRIYFTDDAITAHEDCGKNCTKNITALKH